METVLYEAFARLSAVAEEELEHILQAGKNFESKPRDKLCLSFGLFRGWPEGQARS